MMKIEDSLAQEDHSLTVPIKIECEFCEQHFENTTDRNTHIMEHFVREFCSECNKVLLRIGDEVYTLHSTVTCISDENEYGGEQTHTFPINESCPTTEDLDLKIESICVEAWENVNDNTEFHGMNSTCRDLETAPNLNQLINQTLEFETETKLKDSKIKAKRNAKIYKCRYLGCNEYVSMNCWSYHKAKHRNEKFECDICKSTFWAKYKLQKHILNKHDPNYTNQNQKQKPEKKPTERSQAVAKPKKAKKETVDRNAKVYKCEFEGCNEFFSKNSWSYHMAKHRNETFECDICKMTFPTKCHIRSHIVSRHDPTNKVKKKPKKKIVNREKAKKERKTMPKVEDNTIEKKLKEYKCKFEGCNQFVRKNNWSYHMAKHRNQTFECDICKSTFLTKSQIRLHILNKHDPTSKKLQCDVCGSKFLTKGVLAWHQKLWHLKERNFMCSVCGKRYTSQAMLKMHMNLHTGEKPYECKFEGCTKRFRTQAQRHEHFRCHSGEKPFHCPVDGCVRQFAYTIDLKRHKFNAHGIYTKKYPCQICEEIFPENMLLTKHMKKHEIQTFN